MAKKLVGNQKKLDRNKNGKIDSGDFKLINKEKNMKKKPKGMKNGGKAMKPKGMKNGGNMKPKGMKMGGKVIKGPYS